VRRFRERLGCHRRRAICSAVVWICWNYLSKVRPFSKVDDALGVIYTHGIAASSAHALGIFGDPNTLELGCGTLNSSNQVINTTQQQYNHVPWWLPRRGERPDVHRIGPSALGTVPGRHLVIFWSALVTLY